MVPYPNATLQVNTNTNGDLIFKNYPYNQSVAASTKHNRTAAVTTQKVESSLEQNIFMYPAHNYMTSKQRDTFDISTGGEAT